MISNQWNVFSPAKKILKKATKLSQQIDDLKGIFRKKSNQELSEMTNGFADKLKRGQSLDDILPQAFATIRETIYRVEGIFPYKVQLIGAIVAHRGDFSEMYTGEGKTITIIMVAYLNALLKRGVHIVTVNEYLVERDAAQCAKCLNPLGITVGYNLANFNNDQKRAMFACDITYTTNSELGFDYLRDNMVGKYTDKVIRELNFAIIDEADSVLIDEARTPLIISGQPKQDVTLYIEVDEFASRLGTEDFKIDAESNSCSLLDSGIEKAQNYFRIENLFSFANSSLYHKIKNSLMANKVFQNGVEYIVRNNKIFLVDQFTGRIMEGRSYNAGLHQAIQAREKVEIEPENVTVATITYQSFFRQYRKLAGVSGTATTESEEFMKVYNMVVVSVPTNKRVIRQDFNDYVFANKISKWTHVVAEIEKIHATGQPILVGTATVDDSEDLVYFLRNKGINFQLLNAKNNIKEAKIVQLAGQIGSITISTNMAGRGTDIKLGEGVAQLGGLFVIGTEHHESRRVDNQLRGRSGRQGDPGMTRFFISLEDTLFKRFAVEKEKAADKKIDNEFYDSWFFTRLLKNAQKKVEALNYDVRKNLIDYDSILSNQRELVYKQRDQILLNQNNIPIAKNMAKQVCNDIVCLFKLESNETFVNEETLTGSVNKNLFRHDLIAPKFFHKKTVGEAKTILYHIVCLSLDKRAEVLSQEKATMIFRDIMVQALDRQWTEHLDLISKIREGVTLRSLEQRSPLNIYVAEADKRFNNMKDAVAHNVILNISRIFVPKINEAIFDALADVLPLLNISHHDYNEFKEAKNQKIIDDAFAAKSFTTVNTNEENVSPLQMSISAKDMLLKKMQEAKEKQNLNVIEEPVKTELTTKILATAAKIEKTQRLIVEEDESSKDD